MTALGWWLNAEVEALPGRAPLAVRKIIDTQRAREQLLPMVERYAAAKAAREVLDYSDQVALAARIATRHPEVGAGERARYQVVLLDEYQDTSHAQLVLLRTLFGGGHPVTAVGDPCQSIYGWRGASAGNLRRFTVDFPVVAPGRPFGASAPSGPAPVLQLSHQLQELRPGPRRGRRHPGRTALRGARGAQADLRARPDRARRGGLRLAAHGPRRGRVGRRPDCRAARGRAGLRPGWMSLAGRPVTPASARQTSRCCAASGHSSCRCAAPSRPAASRSRSSASAACSSSPRSRTWWPPSGSCTTPAPRTPSPACSPAPGGE